MDISSEVTDAVKRVSETNKDFLTVKNEKLKTAAFEEHIEACLDALDVMAEGGEFGAASYFDITATDADKKTESRIVLAGLAREDSENRNLLVSVTNMSQTEMGPAFLFIEYTPTNEGNKFNEWSINKGGWNEDDMKEVFTTALTQSVIGSNQLYTNRLEAANKH
jgi:hypothetical protein